MICWSSKTFGVQSSILPGKNLHWSPELSLVATTLTDPPEPDMCEGQTTKPISYRAGRSELSMSSVAVHAARMLRASAEGLPGCAVQM